jgi:capsule polysaccharide export protein KpsE/RkpR
MDNQKSSKISEFVYILLRWKKFFLYNLIIIILIASAFAFLIPNNYRATASLDIPPEANMGLAGLTGLMSGKSSASSIGTKLLGISSGSEDILLGLLNSRTALVNVMSKFNLLDYYKVKDGNIDKALKDFRGDLSFETNPFGMIDINVVNENPQLSADIANYFASLVDSMNINLNTRTASNNRLFIEKRYLQNVVDLKNAEDSMYIFQKKYGIFAVPEQLTAAIKSSAELEGQYAQKQIAADVIKNQFGENSPQFLLTQKEAQYFKDKINELKNSSKLSEQSNVLFPFKNVPDITLNYFRNFRNIEMQTKLMEFILPMYEQAKVEEQKSIPTVILIDKAYPPQVKYSPKRGLIILGLTSLGFFLLLLISLRAESAVIRESYINPFEEKESRLFRKIASFLKIK